MAKVIFKRRYDHDYRPVKAVCKTFHPSDKRQEVPEHIAKAAIAAGAAEAADPPKKGE